MKKIDGIQIGGQILRYGSNVFQTDGGYLLKFTSGAEQWQGVFPGCSWDEFYDTVMMGLCSKNLKTSVLKQRRAIPTLIVGSDVGSCWQCRIDTEYKFCSVSCWFFYTIEMTRQIIAESDSLQKIDYHTSFVEQMVALYGKQVDAELNPTQL
jgi:hypothetical protein